MLELRLVPTDLTYEQKNNKDSGDEFLRILRSAACGEDKLFANDFAHRSPKNDVECRVSISGDPLRGFLLKIDPLTADTSVNARIMCETGFNPSKIQPIIYKEDTHEPD